MIRSNLRHCFFVAVALHHEEELGHVKLVITHTYLLASMTGLIELQTIEFFICIKISAEVVFSDYAAVLMRIKINME